MASRSPHAAMRRRAAFIVLFASLLIGAGVAFWWQRAPEQRIEKRHGGTGSNTPSVDLQTRQKEAHAQVLTSNSKTIATRLEAFLAAQETIGKRTGTPSKEARLTQLIKIHTAAYGSVNVMPRILTLCDDILRTTPDHADAIKWRLAALLDQATPLGPVPPMIEDAWQTATTAMPKDPSIYHLFCTYLRNGSDNMRERALQTAESAASNTNSFGCRLLLLETQLELSAPEAKGPIERRILAFQRRPPTNLPPQQLIRLARLSAFADPLPVADSHQTLAAGILRAQRLIKNQLKHAPSAPLLRASAMLAAWAGQSESTLAYAQQLHDLAIDDNEISGHIAKAANQRYANFITGLVQLHKLRLMVGTEDLTKERELFNAAYQALATNAGEDSWESQTLAGMTSVLIGKPDAGTRTLTQLPASPSNDWQALIDSWLGLAYWQSGNPEGVIQTLQDLPTAASLPVPLRREAAELSIRCHLLLKDTQTAAKFVSLLEGLVQRDAPLDHANLLIHLVESATNDRASNPLAVVAALKRLQNSQATRTYELLNAGFAKAIRQSERARIRAASLTKSYPNDILSWYFQHALLTEGTPSAVRSCQQMLAHLDDNAVKENLSARLQRPSPNTKAISRRILAAACAIPAEGKQILSEIALLEGDYHTARENAPDATAAFSVSLASQDLMAAETYVATLPPDSPQRITAQARLLHASGRPVRALAELARVDASPETNLLMAIFHKTLHDAQPAQIILQQLLKESPRNTEARTLLIETLQGTGHSNATHRIYDDHVQQSLPAWLIPIILDRLGRTAPALSLFRLSNRISQEALPHPTVALQTNFQTLPAAAAALGKENRDASARALIASFARITPQSPWETQQLARAARKIPDVELAHNYYSRAVEADKSQTPSIHAEWLRWSAEESPNKTPLETIQNNAEQNHPEIQIAAARLALACDLPKLAEKTIKNTATSAAVYAIRGRAAQRQGREQEASDLYKLAIDLDPNSPAARLGQASLASEWTTAATDLTIATREVPTNAMVLISAARIAADHDRARETIRYAVRATELAPMNAPLAETAATLLLHVDAWQELQSLIQSDTLRPDASRRIRVQLAFLIGDKETQLELIPQVLADAAKSPALAIPVIRAAVEHKQITAATAMADSLRDLPSPTFAQLAAVQLPASQHSLDAATALFELADKKRWIALAAAESNSLPVHQRADALATALADATPWHYPDLRTAARLAETFPSTELGKLLETRANAANLPAHTRATALLAIGIIQTKFGKPQKAIEWYRRSLRIIPDDQVRMRLAQAYGAYGNQNQAETILKQLDRSIDPDLRRQLRATRQVLEHHHYLQQRAQNKLPQLHLASGNQAAANLLISLDTWDKNQNRLAQKLLGTQILETQMNSLSQRLAQSGGSTATNNNQVAVAQNKVAFQLKHGDYVKARKILLDAVRTNDSDRLRLQLATVCEALGWYDEAEKHRKTVALRQIPELLP